MLKLFVFTDIHASRSGLEKLRINIDKHKPDLLICAGDISIFENGLEYTIKKLGDLGTRCLLIHGNHEDETLTQGLCRREKSLVFIHRQAYYVGDTLFLGFGGGGFSQVDSDFDEFIGSVEDKIGRAADIVLVVHQPIHNTKTDQLYSGSHVGNKSYRKFIQKYSKKIRLVVCGHIHDSFGTEDEVGGVKIVNPGPDGKFISI